MKRRAFLKFLGLAPVAAAVPAMALPRPDSPLAYGEAIKGVPLYDPRKDVSIEAWSEEITKPLIFKDGKFWVNPANIGQITAGKLRTSNGIEMDMQAGNVRFTV
ncbi:twin-arginine translocation signal domain-containing protein [Brucella anthropi]|uniref:twin-arginine translocation signal domain-containing protein n=1 Tax=Brucella anthropi TaxID=529 RepID=UPI00028861CF|nr:twin-arginine translocation signal domain-containing protein [Brucella anthropi]